MYAEERHQDIVELARATGSVAVSRLAVRYGVTSETIRRDLDSLAMRGLLSRVHGGAVPSEKLHLIEAPLPHREITCVREKDAIAARALDLLPERHGLSVLLDAGTTTARLASLLPESVSLVMTNSVPAAVALASRRHMTVRMLGGTVRELTLATVGAAAYEEIRKVRVDVAFLGANGFSVDHGFSTPDPDEARMKEAMVGSAREIHVLADASKWGADYLVSFAACSQVDTLVTDSGLPGAAAGALRASGLRVEQAVVGVTG